NNTSVGVRWRPPNISAWSARQIRAERHADQSLAELETAQRDLAAQVRLLHARWLNLGEQHRNATTAIEVRDRLRTLIGRQLEHQAATVLDRNLAELDYLEAIADREEIEGQRVATYRDLITALGVAPDTEYQPVASAQPTCRLPDGDLEPLIARARSSAPELRGLRAQHAEAGAEIDSAHLELIPWFDFVHVGFELGEGPTRWQWGANDGDYAALRLRLSINFPLFDWKQAEVAGWRARQARLAAEQRAAEAEAEGGVRRAVEELRGRVALVERHDSVDATVVEASLGQIDRALDAGEVDLVQMALLQRRILATQRDRLRAILRCQESAIELARLTGDAVLTGASGAAPRQR
ncbi:MAG: TolC family protein, partial [Deltaproteobacteria bacterium]|nr:TolC family protein [Deltaproteobacteria bacterium]